MSRMPTLALTVLLVSLSPLRGELYFSQPAVQLGDVYIGRPLRQTFAFTNPGPGLVRIVRLSATCGCMTPRLEKDTYQVGESGSFVLEVNTLTQPAGPNRWNVDVVYSDAGERKTRQLHVLANLLREITVEPAKLALSTSGPIEHEITITDQRALPLRVLEATTGSAHLRTTVSGQGQTHRIKLKVKDSLPAGAHEGTLAIVTDDPKYRELRIPLTIHKRTRTGVSAAPSTVNLTASKGQPASRMVLLRGEEEKPVVVEKVETDNPALTCRWAKGPGVMATLRVSVDGAKVTETLRGNVRVQIGKPSPVTIVIPVTCSVR